MKFAKNARTFCSTCSRILPLAILTLGQFSSSGLYADDSPATDEITFLTRSEFRESLDKSISASWEQVPLRQVFRRISQDRQIAILLDRRLDPTLEPTLNLQGMRLEKAIERVADSSSAKVSLVGSCVFVGPRLACNKLRTLIHLRGKELYDESLELDKGRHFDLASRTTIRWNDLDRPADVLEDVASHFKLSLLGRENVPHDLWAGAILPSVNAAEALSLILIQFDLTFRWTKGASGIEIVPGPHRPQIEETYRPRGKTPQQAAKEWQETYPLTKATIRERNVVVTATLEEHEAIQNELNPKTQKSTTQNSTTVLPLNRRLFTLRVEKVPARAVMAKLIESGIAFRYDAETLRAANIDLDIEISFDVKKASAEKFFDAMFGPIGVEFSIDDTTVTLKPK